MLLVTVFLDLLSLFELTLDLRELLGSEIEHLILGSQLLLQGHLVRGQLVVLPLKLQLLPHQVLDSLIQRVIDHWSLDLLSNRRLNLSALDLEVVDLLLCLLQLNLEFGYLHDLLLKSLLMAHLDVLIPPLDSLVVYLETSLLIIWFRLDHINVDWHLSSGRLLLVHLLRQTPDVMSGLFQLILLLYLCRLDLLQLILSL